MYYAVIFTSKRSDFTAGYDAMATKMANLAKTMPGYIGVDSARSDIGITVSYWQTLDDIMHWKSQSSHLIAQQQGKSKWYENYTVRICKVEREYSFDAHSASG